MTHRIDARGKPDVQLRFTNDGKSASLARQALGTMFAEGESGYSDVALATSELVSNVVMHTTGGGELQAWAPHAGLPLRVEVHDTSFDQPRLTAEAVAIGGRGLRLVAAVAAAWGVTATVGGKFLWAEFGRAPAPAVV
jgi:anti-sigma regulatory factor (Ser/Thr protein kinase)